MLKPLRRGLQLLPDLSATTRFPLHLVRRAERYRLSRRPLILPFYHDLDSLDLAEKMPQVSRGTSLALQTVGLTGEYVGSREYQPGVPVRKWDYASWARLAQPVVREFSEPRHPSATLILDTSVPTDGWDGSQPISVMEAIISLGASVAVALIEQGNRVELLAVGDELQLCDGHYTGEDPLAILEKLALAQPTESAAIPELTDRLERTPETWDLVVVISHRWDAVQERLYQSVSRTSTTGTRVVICQQPSSTGRSISGDVVRLSCDDVEMGHFQL
jgi:uncharacterized protein (DUF58 family)